jgi:hypothetical protein
VHPDRAARARDETRSDGARPMRDLRRALDVPGVRGAVTMGDGRLARPA